MEKTLQEMFWDLQAEYPDLADKYLAEVVAYVDQTLAVLMWERRNKV